VVPLLVALLLAAGGGFLRLGAEARGSADTANLALIDTAAGGRLTGEVGAALARVFSYSPADTDATTTAARDVLDDTAAAQYRALMDELRRRVAEQRLTLTTRVVRIGVVRLTAGHAQLLVYLDQTAQREGAPATVAPAQLSVTARLDGGHWRITDLKAR
jgi:Mce-associated membrane protein